ncbi:peptide chain release factor N(5)-glutamine methyltransferase [Ferrimonas marina]|uniref:Release factor glutamine methyltransferase n=1 Tax=Ferrimonas marina TaxID=299255 RepID=A0A1M5SCJ9_9GAMM|nr:peptide chain release factor N(5)-glutamine methyltransferase [Ferrimonas marina]SHH36191.1 release factor glutamine methyltransferase [Ferrimonas marina]
MRIDQWLRLASAKLAEAGSQSDPDSPGIDAEVLLLSRLDKPRSFLFTWPDQQLSEALQAQLAEDLQRRFDGEPVAHITGHREFWTLTLETNASTLIPRPDTESLVEAALALPLPQSARVVDLGTGTGAIALALASERPQWQVCAVEYSAEAAALARRNAQRHGLDVPVHQGSWYQPLQGQRFDLVVSNPPYIDPVDHHLDQGDVRFEPRSALIAPQQGLADIRHLAQQAQTHLHPGGVLMVEHGHDQGEAVRGIFAEAGLVQVSTGQDLGRRDRYTIGRAPR